MAKNLVQRLGLAVAPVAMAGAMSACTPKYAADINNIPEGYQPDMRVVQTQDNGLVENFFYAQTPDGTVIPFPFNLPVYALNTGVGALQFPAQALGTLAHYAEHGNFGNTINGVEISEDANLRSLATNAKNFALTGAAVYGLHQANKSSSSSGAAGSAGVTCPAGMVPNPFGPGCV